MRRRRAPPAGARTATESSCSTSNPPSCSATASAASPLSRCRTTDVRDAVGVVDRARARSPARRAGPRPGRRARSRPTRCGRAPRSARASISSGGGSGLGGRRGGRRGARAAASSCSAPRCSTNSRTWAGSTRTTLPRAFVSVPASARSRNSRLPAAMPEACRANASRSQPRSRTTDCWTTPMSPLSLAGSVSVPPERILSATAGEEHLLAPDPRQVALAAARGAAGRTRARRRPRPSAGPREVRAGQRVVDRRLETHVDPADRPGSGCRSRAG